MYTTDANEIADKILRNSLHCIAFICDDQFEGLKTIQTDRESSSCDHLFVIVVHRVCD